MARVLAPGGFRAQSAGVKIIWAEEPFKMITSKLSTDLKCEGVDPGYEYET